MKTRFSCATAYFDYIINRDIPWNLQSLGIMALIPASILIVYLVGVLMYLLTRCCDRKSRQQSNGCQKCTLIFFSIICAIAVGAGKRLYL